MGEDKGHVHVKKKIHTYLHLHKRTDSPTVILYEFNVFNVGML